MKDVKEVVLTGGPCGGKSTILKELKKIFGNNIITVPEATTELFNNGWPLPPWNKTQKLNFEKAVLFKKFELEETAMNNALKNNIGIIIYDRGILDGVASWPDEITNFYDTFQLNENELLEKYDLVIHLESLIIANPNLYLKLVGSNPKRYEHSIDQARETELKTQRAWFGHNNRQHLSGSIEEKTNAVIELISNFLPKNLEIEKKFLLTELPSGLRNETKIKQGYLSLEKTEIRLRLFANRYFITRKDGTGFIRFEQEEEISRKVFEILWPATECNRLSKTRYYSTATDGLVWEIDEYHGKLKNLFIAEVELPSAETPYIMPKTIKKVLIKDVTNNKEYSNRYLAKTKI